MWFVSSNNQQTGPFDERDIAVGLAQGVYNAHTMVWREGLPQWAHLAHSELAKYLPKIPMPPMPMPIPASAPMYATPSNLVSVRDRIFGGIGLVWGSIALVNGVLTGIRSLTGFLFSLVMILVGGYYCFGKPKNYFVFMGIATIGLIFFAVAKFPNRSATEATKASAGDTFRTEKFEITITNAVERSSVGSEFFVQQPSTGATFIAVQATIKNISSRPINSFSMPDIHLIAPDGIRFDPDIGASSSFATELDLDEKVFSDLNPGITTRSASVFEIAQDQFDQATWRILVDADEPIYVTFVAAAEPSASTSPPPKIMNPQRAQSEVPKLVQMQEDSLYQNLQQLSSEAYFQNPANSLKTGEQLAVDYMSGLFAKCGDELVAFTAGPPSRDGEIATFTLWQWRGLEVAGVNSTIPLDLEDEFIDKYGLFHINPDLLDEQSKLNGISDVAGFHLWGARHSFYRYREFGTSNSAWSSWYKNGERSPKEYPPNFAFVTVKHEGKWTHNYRLSINTIDGERFEPTASEYAQLDAVLLASKAAEEFLRSEGCSAYRVQNEYDAPAAEATPASALLEPATGFAPSFDCAKVSTAAERLICSNRDLAEVDVEMSQAYKSALASASDREVVKAAQRNWNRTIRDVCADVSCMLSAYNTRIAELAQ